MSTATLSAETFAPRVPRVLPNVPTALVFFSIVAFVGAVSLYDGYLVIRTGRDIREFEKNPVGTLLLDWGHGDPTLFLSAKALGTTLALGFLTVLYRRCRRVAFPVAYALLFFQTALLIFLERA